MNYTSGQKPGSRSSTTALGCLNCASE
jgi:hypothetical protein